MGRIVALADALAEENITVRHICPGGGIGIKYKDEGTIDLDVYARALEASLADRNVELLLEPGRVLVGNAGVLVSRVEYVKPTDSKNFLVIDAAMNDLIRPAMYGAHHDIVAVVEPSPGTELQDYDIVGPVCETGDTFARARPLPPLAEGDLMAFRSAGAYGAVMSSEYNTRPLIPEILVKGDQFAVIRARPSFEEMINRDSIPIWL